MVGAPVCEPFGMGIGLSTGEVAAALLGSDERIEYTVVGDVVNLSQRLQDLARPAGTTVLPTPRPPRSDRTAGLWNLSDSRSVKGRDTPVHRVPPDSRTRGAI